MTDVKKSWKPETWYNASMKEYAKYKKTKDLETFAQAGEKLYNSITLLLDERTGKKLRNYKQIKAAAMQDPFIKKIFEDAYWLHVFFYRGFTEDISQEEEKFKNVRDKLKKVI